MSYMSKGIGYHIARVACYAEALAKFNSTKPIRGHKDAVRPLGERMKHHIAAIRLADTDVELCYVGDPLVVWHPNDSFTLTAPSHVSFNTPAAIRYYLPIGSMSFEVHRGQRIFVSVSGKKYILDRDTALVFDRVTGGAVDKYVLRNPEKAYNIRQNRKVMQDHMAAFAGFFSWAQVMLAVNEDRYDQCSRADAAYGVGVLAQNSGVDIDLLVQREKAAREAEHQAAIRQGKYGTLLPSRKGLYEAANETQRAMFLPGGVHTRSRYRGGQIGFHRRSTQVMLDWMRSGDGDAFVQALKVIYNNVGFTSGRGQSHGRLNMVAVRDYVKNLVCFMYRDEVFSKVDVTGSVPSLANTDYLRPEFVFSHEQTDNYVGLFSPSI